MLTSLLLAARCAPQMWGLPWKQANPPWPRHGHASARLGTSKWIIFGGRTDGGGYVEDTPTLIGECATWALDGTRCVTLHAVEPRSVPTHGGATIRLQGQLAVIG